MLRLKQLDNWKNWEHKRHDCVKKLLKNVHVVIINKLSTKKAWSDVWGNKSKTKLNNKKFVKIPKMISLGKN